MNDEIEALYRRIGQGVADLVGGSFHKAYVRVEMADDYGTLGAFYDPGTGEFQYAGDDDALFVDLRRRACRPAWGRGRGHSPSTARKFSVDFG